MSAEGRDMTHEAEKDSVGNLCDSLDIGREGEYVNGNNRVRRQILALVSSHTSQVDPCIISYLSKQ